jgi:hypothetical protein
LIEPVADLGRRCDRVAARSPEPVDAIGDARAAQAHAERRLVGWIAGRARQDDAGATRRAGVGLAVRRGHGVAVDVTVGVVVVAVGLTTVAPVAVEIAVAALG